MNSQSLAIVFPGQGSQSPGMLSELADSYEIVQQSFDTASEQLGYDLWQIVQENPDNLLNQTAYTQPALLTSSVALWRCLNQKIRLESRFMAGHSLGEYSALVCSEALAFEDAVRLVSLRGQEMQTAVNSGEGAMAAILGIDNAIIEQVCHELSNEEHIVSLANFNCPGQTVIAGHTTAVEQAVERLKTQGAKRAIMLPVSVPSHCALMKPAAEALADALNTVSISKPNCEVVNNVDGKALSEPDAIKDALIRQLYHPVQWVTTIEHITSQGVDTFIECGPGKVLAGLNKKINKSTTTLGVESLSHLTNTISQCELFSEVKA